MHVLGSMNAGGGYTCAEEEAPWRGSRFGETEEPGVTGTTARGFWQPLGAKGTRNKFSPRASQESSALLRGPLVSGPGM